MEVDQKGFEVITILDESQVQPFIFTHETAVKVIEEAIQEAVEELRAVEIQEGFLAT